MINIGFTSIFPNFPIAYQTPGRLGFWGNYRWFINPETIPPTEPLNYWVVYEDMTVPLITGLCAPENTIFVAQEHTDHYSKEYLAQFAMVISHLKLEHPNLVRSMPGAAWHMYREIGVGVPDTFLWGYDELKVMHPTKTKLLSVISSTKYPKRLEFARKIKAHFGDSCDLFGGGVNFIPRKWDAVAPYKYHVALENFALPHCVSEKLTDCYLGEAFPFYRGCPNVGDYFPTCAVLPEDDDAAVEYIESAINLGLYEAWKPTLLVHKNRVLDEYNIFPLLIGIIEKHGMNPAATPSMITIHKNTGK